MPSNSPVGAPVRILGVGAGVPALRCSAGDIGAAWGRGGRGQIGTCAPDEDTLTLAWTAATAALTAAGVDAASVDAIFWGTSRPPFAEGPSLAFLSAALSLPPSTGGALVSGSAHAGMDALAAGADAIGAGSARVVLVVASDSLRPGLGTGFEARCGAGAAALVLGTPGGAAALGARVTHSRPLVDRYRGDGEIDNRDLYDARLFREEMFLPSVETVVRELADHAVDSWSLPDPDGRLGAVVAKRVGANPAASAAVYTAIGDTGTAAALLGAIGAMEREGTVAIVGTGGGRTSAVVVTVDAPVPGAGAVAVRTRGRPARVVRRGAAVARPARGGRRDDPDGCAARERALRGADEMFGLLAGRCVDCGTISTPPSIHPSCTNCGGPKLEPVSVARAGTVHTYVVNHTMPAPFVAPLPIAVLDLDDGARLMLQVVGDGSDVEIGRRVELVLRRYARRARRARVRVQGASGRQRGRGGVVMAWNRVAVVGAGFIKMGELFEQSYEQMAAGAFDAAVGERRQGVRTAPGRRGLRGDAARHAVGPGGHRRQHHPQRHRPSTASRARGSRTPARRAPTRSASAPWWSRAACTTSCS